MRGASCRAGAMTSACSTPRRRSFEDGAAIRVLIAECLTPGGGAQAAHLHLYRRKQPGRPISTNMYSVYIVYRYLRLNLHI